MKSAASLSPGKTRKDIEDAWTSDGGLQSRTRSRYRFRNCDRIKIDVELKVAPSAPKYGWSDEDTITDVPKPYLENPAFD